MGFKAYGYRFPSWSSARKYRALVLILEKSGVDGDAAVRMGARFIAEHHGVEA